MEPELTKKERRKLAKEEKERERKRKERNSKIKKAVFVLLVLTVVGYAAFWLYSQLTSPLPGQSVSDMGREHVADILEINYNSNPPTSGPHFGVWAKRGVYDSVLSDGYLIHSLEHGYIVISYNCEGKFVELPREGNPLTKFGVGIQEGTSFFTPKNPPEEEVGLPESFASENCRSLVNNLSSFLENYERVIIVPRANLDTKIALTAWGRIDKMDEFDEKRIENFMSSFENRGPEQTIE